MRRIAVTGGIAEGKSTVVGYIAEAGVATASSDAIARDVFAREEVQARLSAILRVPAPVEAATVRSAISENPDLRRQVNRAMHPEILRRIEAAEAAVVEVPLLLEACLQGLFERVWVVTCGPEEQLRRLTERLGDETAARRLVRTQLPTPAKLPFADRIIRTDRPPALVKGYVLEQIHAELGAAVASGKTA
ncbi:MAG: dephospho-CoA kinase [Fimbriimonadaceae bacterium]